MKFTLERYAETHETFTCGKCSVRFKKYSELKQHMEHECTVKT